MHWNRKKKWDRFNVLFAIDKTGNGLITIVVDFSDDYGALIPKQHGLAVLWAAFEDLVIRILLPLADLDIIVHPDIRAGWVDGIIRRTFSTSRNARVRKSLPLTVTAL